MKAKIYAVLAVMAALFGMLLVTSGPASATGIIDDYPNGSTPYCVTYLPNASGQAPDQNCYSYQPDMLNEVHRWHRLWTDYQNANFSGWRVAAVTRRDVVDCFAEPGDVKMYETYMPKGWNYEVSSTSLDDHNCGRHDLYSQTQLGGYVAHCGDDAYNANGGSVPAVCADLSNGYGLNDNIRSEIGYDDRV